MRKITIEVPDNIADDLIKQYDKKTPWEPKDGQEYWNISWSGVILRDRWTNTPQQKAAYVIGNCYRTAAEAQNAVEQMKALATIRRHAEQFNYAPDWTKRDIKHYVYYDHENDKLDWGSDVDFQHYSPTYYPSIKAAKQAISEVGDSYLTLFGVKS